MQNYFEYKITVPGEPVAKARPRVTNKGITYTPKKTKNYETLVSEIYFSQHGQTMLEGELSAEIVAYFSIPKSTSKRAKAEMQSGKMNPTKKPDLDNIAKAILDALNSIAYKDDSQVIQLVAEKKYSDTPRVELTLKKM